MKEIIIKTPQGEMSLKYICDKEYKRLNSLLSMLETEFDTDMNQHQELRKFILDTSNFIQRIPQMISEVI